MYTTTLNNENFQTLVESVIKHDDTVSISTENGSAVLVRQEKWDSLLETLYLQSVPGMVESIHAASAEPLENCISVEELLADV